MFAGQLYRGTELLCVHQRSSTSFTQSNAVELTGRELSGDVLGPAQAEFSVRILCSGSPESRFVCFNTYCVIEIEVLDR